MKKIKIGCIGDSITFGYGNLSKDSYPARLQSLLGDGFEVKNFGVSGTCALDTADCPYRNTIQYTASLKYDPDMVIIMLGTNDSKIANFACHDNDYRNDLAELILRYQNLKSNPFVFIATSPTAWRNYEEAYHDYMIVPEIIHERIWEMQKEAADLFQCPVIDIHEQTKGLGELFPDGVHPNEKGYARVAEMMYQGIFPYIHRIATKTADCTLEYYEWCDVFIEDMKNREKKRVLLIGDSISRDYRPLVSEYLGEAVLVDQLASSKSLDNPEYIKDLARLLEDERLVYDAIHFNNGLHGMHMSEEVYRIQLQTVVEYIKEHSSAKLILALSTPVFKPDELYENDKNRKIVNRNQQVSDFAQKFSYPINDLYRVSFGREDIRLKDGIHYNLAGSALQAERISVLLKELL